MASRRPKGRKQSALRKDGRRIDDCGGKYFYDEAAAEHAVLFFEKYLRHSKGEWAGQPLNLEAWQKSEVIRPLFGWKHVDSGLRRFRVLWLEVPSGNGKSTLAAGIGCYLLIADGEPGAEVYSAASDRNQAGVIFNQAKAMVETSPKLRKMLDTMRQVIVDRATGNSIYRVLSADAPRQEGLNSHGTLFDEVHTQPNGDLWHVLKKAGAKRRQPMTIATTTAGDDTDSLCFELHEYARQIKEGLIEDDTWLVVLYAADKDADWTDPKVWAKCNPNLGISPKLEALEAECMAAKRMPRHENAFRRYRLNQWVSQATRWIPMREWNKCKGPIDWLTMRQTLLGKRCFAGFDLSSNTDITSLLLVFPDGRRMKWLPFFWIPEENIESRGKAHGDLESYRTWVKQGLIRTTPGNAIDHDKILSDFEQIRNDYQIAQLAFDPWGMARISPKLQDMDVEVVEFRQGYKSMSEPSKLLETKILRTELEHGGNPVLSWMADNAVVMEDEHGNIKPVKKKSRKKIDGIVAGIMGTGRAFIGDDQGDSVYESQGLDVIGGGQ